MKFPDLAYISWAKSLPEVAINLARSGIDHCPASLLRLKASDLVARALATRSEAPGGEGIAAGYEVAGRRVFPVSGGTCAASCTGCSPRWRRRTGSSEVIVERPTYE